MQPIILLTTGFIFFFFGMFSFWAYHSQQLRSRYLYYKDLSKSAQNVLDFARKEVNEARAIKDYYERLIHFKQPIEDTTDQELKEILSQATPPPAL